MEKVRISRVCGADKIQYLGFNSEDFVEEKVWSIFHFFLNLLITRFTEFLQE